jgi:DNA-directed RNA polymerase subunit M/transcription elongation factor TFIIS
MFCEQCSNLCELQDSISEKILYSICLSCGYREIVKNPCIFKKNYNTKYKHNDFTLDSQFQDPTLPISARKCKTCKNRLHYARNANLSSTFICSECRIKI